MGEAETVLLAEIDRPRGLRGEVLARLHADDPERLDEVTEVEIVAPRQAARSARIEGWKRCGERVVLKLSGFDTVESAEALRGAELRIPREAAAGRGSGGRWHAYEIEGMEVVGRDGRAIGRVRRILRPAGQSLLEVEGPDKVFLVPFVPAICVEVDAARGRIVIDPPEGLLEL